MTKNETVDNLHLEAYRKKQIPEMIDSVDLWNKEFLATTKHRLNVHYHNPAMEDDDVVLIVAWFKEEIIGYIGGFCDNLLTGNGYEKITWLHSWWMNPEYRYTKAGRLLFEKMYEVCNGKIGISQFTPSAARIYYKSGKFNVLTKMEGAKFIVSLNSLILFPELNKSFRAILMPFLKVGQFGVNFIAFLLRKASSMLLKRHKVECLSVLDKETVDFINEKQPTQICKRQKDFFDFLFRYNVILRAYGDTEFDNRYYFSSNSSQFNYFYLKTKNQEGMVDLFLVLQVRGKVLKVLFAYYNDEALSKAADLIHFYINKLKIDTLYLYDDKLIKSLRRSRLSYLIERKKEKEVLVSKSFTVHSKWSDLTFNYGDGDCCFA